MPKQVVNGAQMACSFGAAPSSLQVLPTNQVKAGDQYAATIMDYIPMANIMPFGMCASPANPQVAAATAAALGVLTPQPCIPATSAPWMPGSPMIQIAGLAALDDACTCLCTWAGMITITQPGQTVKANA